jgi:hypothetical protein
MNQDVVLALTVPGMFGWFAWLVFNTIRRYKIAKLADLAEGAELGPDEGAGEGDFPHSNGQNFRPCRRRLCGSPVDP